MKTYVITLSEYFPATHPRKGIETNFPTAILDGRKIHTIRGNYPFWKKRFEKINKGEAYLSVRKWSGNPYRSKQVELVKLTREDGIGLQSLRMTPLGWFVDEYESKFTIKDFSKNDGLEPMDFFHWFRGKISIDMEPMALIHFTSFRY